MVGWRSQELEVYCGPQPVCRVNNGAQKCIKCYLGDDGWKMYDVETTAGYAILSEHVISNLSKPESSFYVGTVTKDLPTCDFVTGMNRDQRDSLQKLWESEIVGSPWENRQGYIYFRLETHAFMKMDLFDLADVHNWLPIYYSGKERIKAFPLVKDDIPVLME